MAKSQITQPLDCQEATENTQMSEIAFNEATDENYTELCEAYKTALENQILACGDTDGNLQMIIDNLGDCILDSEMLLVREIVFTDISGEVFTSAYSYQGNRLISITSSEGESTDYIYENDVLVRINETDANDNILDFTELSYNTDGQLITYSTILIDADQGYRTELTYNSDGTITQETYIGNAQEQNELFETSVLTLLNGQIIQEADIDGTVQIIYNYDANNGIYKNISHIDVIHLLSFDFTALIGGKDNNLIEFIQDDGSGGTETELYTYTYNTLGYPVTAEYRFDGELEGSFEFFY